MSNPQAVVKRRSYADEFDLVFALPCSGKTWIASRCNKFIDADTLFKFPGTAFWEIESERVSVEEAWAMSVFNYLDSSEKRDGSKTVLMAPNHFMYKLLPACKGLRIGKYLISEEQLKENYASRKSEEPERPCPDLQTLLKERKQLIEERMDIVDYLAPTECALSRLVKRHLDAFLDSPGSLTRMLTQVSTIAVDRRLSPKEEEECYKIARRSGFSHCSFHNTSNQPWLLSRIIDKLAGAVNTLCIIVQVDRERFPERFLEYAAVCTMAVMSEDIKTSGLAALDQRCSQHPEGCLRLSYSIKTDIYLAIKQVRTMFCVVENVTREVVVADDELRSKLISALPAYLHEVPACGIEPSVSSVRLLKRGPKDAVIEPLTIDLTVTDFPRALEFVTQVIPWLSIPWDHSRIVLKPLCETGRSGKEWLELFDSKELSLVGHDVEPWKVRFAMLTKPPGKPITIHPLDVVCEATGDVVLPWVTEGNDEAFVCDECINRLNNSGVDPARLIRKKSPGEPST